jgi:flagellar basal body-associated protein FliL
VKSKIMYILSALVVVVLIAGGVLTYIEKKEQAEEKIAAQKAEQRYESLREELGTFLASVQGKENALSTGTRQLLDQLEESHRLMTGIYVGEMTADEIDTIAGIPSLMLAELKKQVPAELKNGQ